MSKKVNKPEDNKVTAVLSANKQEYRGEGETIQEALLNITVRLVYTGGKLVISKGKEIIEKDIHIMQMKRLFGINKTTIKLYAKQLAKIGWQKQV